MPKVIVIGAGAAGLAAAGELAKAGVAVEVLEARGRSGGRILTIPGPGVSCPVDLGAEFIHGTKNSVWTMIRGTRLKTVEAHNGQRMYSGSRLRPAQKMYDQLQTLFNKIDRNAPDVSVDRFLDSQKKVPNEWFVRMFVEGFDAADTKLISTHALAKAELSESGGEDKDFRIVGGYKMLVDRLQKRAEKHSVKIHFETAVQCVKWGPGKVEVVTQTKNGLKTFKARHAVITLPVSILKNNREVKFVPELESKTSALAGLEMGSIVKVVLEFQEYFWTKRAGRKDFGFIHDEDGSFRTWWSTPIGPILTGWVGGPSSKQISRRNILEIALHDLGRIFRLSPEMIRRQLRHFHFHDWDADPFSKGAYSYTRAGHFSATQELELPVSNTLFFAGEATEGGQAQGTVHGALSSGSRAARKILN